MLSDPIFSATLKESHIHHHALLEDCCHKIIDDENQYATCTVNSDISTYMYLKANNFKKELSTFNIKI
jgi:hypothetical protein